MKKLKKKSKKIQQEFEEILQTLKVGVVEKDSKLICKVPKIAEDSLVRALALLPTEVYIFIAKKYVVMSHSRGEAGGHWKFSSAKGRIGILWFGTELWYKNPMQIAFVVAHEAAHAFKEHNDSLNNEKEADELALKWLQGHYKRKELLSYAIYRPLKKEWVGELEKKDGERDKNEAL